ncbi:NADP-dependent oxidoreductase [Mycolicibacterium hodleri]|uniref:NADP-dependent oxidoreductase n=1 Tax=Mycolicibacterium hodleri TaxID=49897 RepID=A0A502E7R9_9MYCO|nr:NADP-dependent oxidoreductase [Mycolicibacterium hodleri]TPG32491.1 NADP-dependent oxidoreductase [Mycolicibacterium hodleri]
MRAIGFTEFGGPEVLKELDLDEPHAATGQVRIRVHAAAVSPSDTLSRSGAARAIILQMNPNYAHPQPPYVVGWDVGGIVDEIGPDTETALRLGDKVVALADPTAMKGGYVEYLVTPADSAALAPSNSDHVSAATLPMNALTARLALDKLALPAGATLAVTGAAGTLGGYVIELAKLEGLRVIADASEADEALVKELGADVVVPRGADVAARIREVMPEGVDALVDGSCQDGAVINAVRDGGAIVSVRAFVGSDERGIVWHPIFVSDYLTDQAKLDRLCRQVESGDITLRVAGTYPAEQATQAHDRLEAGGVRGRLVLTF